MQLRSSTMDWWRKMPSAIGINTAHTEEEWPSVRAIPVPAVD
jgi:hypothetical protein